MSIPVYKENLVHSGAESVDSVDARAHPDHRWLTIARGFDAMNTRAELDGVIWQRRAVEGACKMTFLL